MQEKTRGIVLRTVKYGEDSMIVDMYTESRGAVGFVMKIPRSRKSALKTVLMRPLSILDISFDFRASASLQRFQDIQVHIPYLSIPYNPIKETIALFLGEFLYYVLRHEDVNIGLFRYLVGSMSWFDTCDERFSNFHLAFLIHLTKFVGCWPNVDDYHRGDYFDMLDGRFTSVQPHHGQFLSPGEAAWIPLFVRMNLSTMHRYLLRREHRNRILQVLNLYYRYHVPEFPELKSIGILREVWA